ncbi:MAG: hypothetical protein IJY15_01490 [Thermoguttaceae bacterium]|nr:hypothetical protein [Thermoguttaceae bacterium]MBQ9126413.1 hypothetical protein [Thermoguttaceae bacterium]
MNKNVKSALIAAVIFGVIIAMFTARRAATESEAELYGNWQMTDASWQTELASRQYGLTAYCVSNIIFCAPSGFSSDARFIAFDRTTVNQGQRVSGDFKYDGNVLICEAPLFGTRMASVEWISDDVIEVQNEQGTTRRYMRE